MRILVVGGSLGAQALNEAVPKALVLLSTPVSVVHQSGEKHLQVLKKNYSDAGVEGELVAFIDDMARRYAEADLVICRAGAVTIAELSAGGMASILVPFPHAVDDHQTANARFLAEKGAAVLVDAGVGTASDAAIAMELGCDGVLMNTAIAAANDPILMASAMKKAVEAGRDAWLAGRMPKKLYSAAPSSPTTGVIASASQGKAA